MLFSVPFGQDCRISCCNCIIVCLFGLFDFFDFCNYFSIPNLSFKFDKSCLFFKRKVVRCFERFFDAFVSVCSLNVQNCKGSLKSAADSNIFHRKDLFVFNNSNPMATFWDQTILIFVTTTESAQRQCHCNRRFLNLHFRLFMRSFREFLVMFYNYFLVKDTYSTEKVMTF